MFHNRYSRPLMTLMFDELDKNLFNNSSHSLFVGNIPVVELVPTLMQHRLMQKSQNIPSINNIDASFCWNNKLVQVLLSKPGLQSPVSTSSLDESSHSENEKVLDITQSILKDRKENIILDKCDIDVCHTTLDIDDRLYASKGKKNFKRNINKYYEHVC